nr:TetR/AcrR family transcriptional regulator [Rhodococcus wratislaviensis]GLK33331.1 putative transcriptional TetR regulatory protein [Rhodococcus wratislaviensis]
MPRNHQEVPRVERERAILEHARELFVRHGYRGTSVPAVAHAVGIAPATVRWYFPTKDELFAAVVSAEFREATSQIESDPDIGGDPRIELVQALLALEPYRALHRDAYERVDTSESVRAAYMRIHNWLDYRVLEIVSQHAPMGFDGELIADTAHVMFEGLLIRSRTFDRPPAAVVELLVETLVATIGQTPERGGVDGFDGAAGP